MDTFEMLKRLLSQNEFIGREVAVFISMGAAHNDHVQRKSRIKQIFVWYIR